MKTDIIKKLESQYLKTNIPDFRIGDELKIYYKIIEGDKERIQPFEGTLIAKKGSGVSKTITLRKISFGEGVERIFPVHSPRIEKIEVIRRGDVRKSKLYYLREKVGRKARIKEKKALAEVKETLKVEEAAKEPVQG
jgi:large subunit ribosomal protein L19